MDENMKYPCRRSIRLRHFDYAEPACYFVTICTRNRKLILGNLVEGTVRLSVLGEIAEDEWRKSEEFRPTLHLDAFVIMPNHLHGLVMLWENDKRAVLRSAKGEGCRNDGRTAVRPYKETFIASADGRTFGGREKRSLSSFVSAFKAATTKRMHEEGFFRNSTLWQRGFFERVIRSREGFERAQRYILENPIRWGFDSENPLRTNQNSVNKSAIP
jgi:REP element-mobilizing transposase RayT